MAKIDYMLDSETPPKFPRIDENSTNPNGALRQVMSQAIYWWKEYAKVQKELLAISDTRGHQKWYFLVIILVTLSSIFAWYQYINLRHICTAEQLAHSSFYAQHNSVLQRSGAR